jgi:hypothetical protein
VASNNPYDGGSWMDSGAGMSDRGLSDGAWDSWTFTPTFDFTAFAENPVAAPPLADQPGDFNGDGSVDAADYGVWRRTFSSESELAADANDNLVVDAADYVVWRKYATGPGGAGTQYVVLQVPEPTGAVLVLFVLVARFVVRFPHPDLRRRSNDRVE